MNFSGASVNRSKGLVKLETSLPARFVRGPELLEFDEEDEISELSKSEGLRRRRFDPRRSIRLLPRGLREVEFKLTASPFISMS